MGSRPENDSVAIISPLLSDENHYSRRHLKSTVVPFFMVWRIQINPNVGVTDRAPKMSEVQGVADATAQWLTTVLSSVGGAGVTVQQVTAAVATSKWEPAKSFPHSISLDVQVTLESSSSSAALPTDATDLLSDVGLRDLRAFVTTYLRASGGSSSIFQYSRDTATYIIQETNNRNPPPTPTAAPPQLTQGNSAGMQTGGGATTATSPSNTGTGNSHGTMTTGRPTARPTGRPTGIPTARPTARPTRATPAPTPPRQSTPAMMPGTTQGTADRAPLTPSNNNAANIINVPMGGENTGSATTPVTLSFGGISEDVDQKPTADELAGLLENTRRFLETALENHYATEPAISFVGVTMTWTQTSYLASAEVPLHVLRADITMWFDERAPTTFADYYVFLLTDILGDTSDYILNYVRTSEPQDSIFRSVRQFTWDFRMD